ncbi:hypothetical protein BU26DRAFT_600187 [Trematosphaeria pertusa]|uniref:Uncharacterized protein n=1 Tax=Trematosphaeria pertusa TaxID=390896 RepID=A0A6A6IVQ1_9PLEO|nr:uncharacterized protein BU26DRAFT_600187 [Trematosphaeria pertusa]KAF2254494.1 hypothetical protein BU26DRAFT_600187 [Trematosphaeria pertusa]
MVYSSFREWMLLSLALTTGFLGTHRFILSSDPQRMMGGRFVNTSLDILFPTIVVWVVVSIKSGRSNRLMQLVLISVLGVVFGGLSLLSILRLEMLFGPVVRRPHALIIQLNVRGIVTTLAAFPMCHTIIFGLFPQLNRLRIAALAQRFTLLDPLPKFLIVLWLCFGLISTYLLRSSLLLVVSLSYFFALRVGD